MSTQPSTLGAETPQSPAALTAVLGLQRQLEALRSWQREQDALLQRLAAESAESESRAAGVRQREVQVGELAGDLERRERQLEARREALAADARQLEKERADLAARRARLRRYARLLRQRRREPTTSEAGGATAVDDLLVQRQLLLDAQRFLAETERHMMRRWAVDRGWRLALCAALFLVGLAVASYAAAHQVAPPLWRATMALGYGAAAGPAASRPRPAAMLGDPVLARAVAELAERGIRPFDGPQALRRELGEHLALAWSDPATLAMSYTAENQSLALFMLEALGESLGADPESAGSEQRPLVVQAAAVDPRPAADRRLSVAARIFALGAALTALAGLVLARRLARRPGLLDVGFGHAPLLELGDVSRRDQAPPSAGSSTG